MPIMEAIAAVGQALDVAKGLRAVEKGWDAAAYKVQIAELMTALSDARLELVAAREAALEKDAEFERLKATLAGQALLVMGRGGFKYKADNSGQPTGLPVCPTCELRDGRLTFTVKDNSPRKVRCPVCNERFDGVAIYAIEPVNEPMTLEDDQHRRSAEGMARLTERLNRGVY
ncbi:hypothetical protein N4G62_06395 [Sphingomonas sanguinis]|uniref:Uncharacterized protein n=2 Tax=Sphingomonas sanguinis TaxID=33051 RepID=A0ABU5LP05_9SPHN|nr:hypothetical protein [Sphingomonas sanguinis]